MAGVRKQHELRAGNSPGDQRAVPHWNETVDLAVDDERRRVDLWQTAVALPGENALQLGVVRLRSRKPGPPNTQVLVDESAWSVGSIDERHGGFRGFLR